jgi:small subunit ribosomal protein S20
MANIKSAIKRNRQAEKRRVTNRSVKTRVNTARTKFLQAVEEGDASMAESSYRAYCSVLDKATKSGVITLRGVSRRKSRGAQKLAAVQSGAA